MTRSDYLILAKVLQTKDFLSWSEEEFVRVCLLRGCTISSEKELCKIYRELQRENGQTWKW